MNLSYSKIRLLQLIVIVLLSFNSLISQDNPTESNIIIADTVLNPGNHLLEIPFKELSGSIKIDCDVSELGELTVNSLIPKQIINYNPNTENVVQFFVSDDENPLQFNVDSLSKDDANYTVFLTALDTMSLIRQVVLSNNEQIKATHNNKDPKEGFFDEELLKWNTIITEIENSDTTKLSIEFQKNELYDENYKLPFNQLDISNEVLLSALAKIRILEEKQIIYGKHFDDISQDIVSKDSLFTNVLDIEIEINDRNEDKFNYLTYAIDAESNRHVYPMNMFFDLNSAYSSMYLYDSNRTSLEVIDKKTIEDNTYFAIKTWAIYFFQESKWLNFTKEDGLIFKFEKSSTHEDGVIFLTFELKYQQERYVFKDQEFSVNEYYWNDDELKSLVIDRQRVYEDFYGYNLEIHSGDSMTIIPKDAKNMSRFHFLATNYYETAEPQIFIDSIPPTIVSTIPADKDTNVSINTVISINFDEEIVPELINANNIIVQRENVNDSIKVVEGSYRYIDTTAEFIPEDSLEYNSIYMVHIANLTDLSGNSIQDYNFSFTTEQDTTIRVDEIKETDYFIIKPNPAKDYIDIILNDEVISLEPEITNFEILDIIGISHNQFIPLQIEGGYRLNISNLQPGIYFIRCNSLGLSKKFIKE